jgi:hypothetical protein
MANRHLGNNYLNNNLNMLSYSNASKNQFTPPRSIIYYYLDYK